MKSSRKPKTLAANVLILHITEIFIEDIFTAYKFIKIKQTIRLKEQFVFFRLTRYTNFVHLIM